MDQLNDYADKRLLIGCIHCAGTTGTRDHVPSRVLLDEPYPENLPVVPACHECNAGFSLDEEYMACLVECATTGSVEAVTRPKIQRILKARPALAERLRQARSISPEGTAIHSCEGDRIRKVVLKLARGHAAYELSEQHCEEPSHFMTVPLHTLTLHARGHFEEVPDMGLVPEIGSRAMQRVALLADWNCTADCGWIEVQPDRYRYFALADGATVMVRIVIGEYLACEIIWAEVD